ncbi:MAG: hypothetical protein U1E51_27295 [Candidatus Binatia bacterium]|nr:hypothetical protein [Candidatus Binatia bacterium]
MTRIIDLAALAQMQFYDFAPREPLGYEVDIDAEWSDHDHECEECGRQMSCYDFNCTSPVVWGLCAECEEENEESCGCRRRPDGVYTKLCDAHLAEVKRIEGEDWRQNEVDAARASRFSL